MATPDQTITWLENFNDDHVENSRPMFSPSHYYDIDKFNELTESLSSKTFSILNTNARSLPKHKTEYEVLMNNIINFHFDVLTFEETWLDENLCDYVKFKGYSMITKHKLQKKEGGGIAIFISDKLEYKELAISVPTDKQNLFDCLFIEIEYGRKSIILGVLYRSPSHNSVHEFNNFIDSVLESFKNYKNKEIIIVGDTNIDLIKSENNALTNAYLDSFISNSFIPKISLPTRVTNNSATLIDHIFQKISDVPTYQGTIPVDITDHYINFISLDLTDPDVSLEKNVTYRVQNEASMNSFKNALNDANWDDVINSSNVDTAYNSFIDIYTKIMNEKLPVRTSKFNRKFHKIKPWITKGIITSMKQRYKLSIKLKKTRDLVRRQEEEIKYKRYRNCLNKLIRAAKQLHWTNSFKSCEKDIKATWKQINNLLNKNNNKNDVTNHFITNDNVTLTNANEIANSFNEYFTNVGPNLSNKITPCSRQPSTFLPNLNLVGSLFLRPTSAEEIAKIIQKFKSKSSYGYDEISPKMLKSTFQPILRPLTHICNLSLRNGIFPDQMKLAKVIPIHKNGPKSSFTNYRPVSLLPTFSKILERLVYNRLQNYLKTNDLLTPCQFGFRENLSTDLAILKLQDLISRTLNKKHKALGLFLDLSKAFDTLNHHTLLDKLYHYGIRGIAHKWFSSYLYGRKQFTYFKQIRSDTLHISTGVPQGSILGPLLFILYINDIAQTASNAQFIIFADDTNIIFPFEKSITPSINQNINDQLKEISDWFSANKLSINVSKTKFMIFHTPRSSVNEANLDFYLNGSQIERVHQIKFLGVILTDTLNWKNHIDGTANKISRIAGIMNKLKHELPSNILFTIYNSLVVPYLNYSLIAWGNSPNSTINRIQVLQKKVMRIIDKKRYNSHTTHSFHKYKSLKLADLYQFRSCLLYYRALNNYLPSYFKDTLKANETTHYHSTRGRANIHINSVQSQIGKQCLNYKIAQSWNSLPEDIKSHRTASIHIFTSKLKTFFINKYSLPCTIRNCYICNRFMP